VCVCVCAGSGFIILCRSLLRPPALTSTHLCITFTSSCPRHRRRCPHDPDGARGRSRSGTEGQEGGVRHRDVRYAAPVEDFLSDVAGRAERRPFITASKAVEAEARRVEELKAQIEGKEKEGEADPFADLRKTKKKKKPSYCEVNRCGY
jgi:hypothetical protein